MKIKTTIALMSVLFAGASQAASPSFVNGLALDGGTVFESVGRWGYSGLLHYELKTGRMIASVKLPDTEFAEGIAVRQHRTGIGGGGLFHTGAVLGLAHRVRAGDVT